MGGQKYLSLIENDLCRLNEDVQEIVVRTISSIRLRKF